MLRLHGSRCRPAPVLPRGSWLQDSYALLMRPRYIHIRRSQRLSDGPSNIDPLEASTDPRESEVAISHAEWLNEENNIVCCYPISAHLPLKANSVPIFLVRQAPLSSALEPVTQNGSRPSERGTQTSEQPDVSCMGTAMDVTCSYDGGDTRDGRADATAGTS